MEQYLLALDQGTTSTRAMLFTTDGRIHSEHRQPVIQHYPHPGWIEHDPEQIWQACLTVCQRACDAVKQPQQILAMGITNQRETTVLWDKTTGQVLHNAIVWQDRRTADFCQALKRQHGEQSIHDKTGLLLDPYFCASKIAWLLDHIPGARAAAAQGKLAVGTMESFVLWRFTGGQQHLSDVTNASRTLLFNLHNQDWDDELLQLFNIPKTLLPRIVDNVAAFGHVKKSLLPYPIPITGCAGDQHAALIGQACVKPGMAKSTYGTGAFLLINTGNKPVFSQHRLLTTMAYRIANQPYFALEGSVFIAGAVIQWLRDQLHCLEDAAQSQQLAMQTQSNAGVYFVPAFTGLGAPHWDPMARGAIIGLTRDTDIKLIVRAALEAVAYQTQDLLLAMQQDGAIINELRIDGGMAANTWFNQFLADILQLPITTPQHLETTAQGAAFLAGIGVGVYPNIDAIGQTWTHAASWQPKLDSHQAQTCYAGWQQAVSQIKGSCYT
jgi:glycerol kinase